MAKQHFKYNPKTLAYEEVKITTGRRILRILLWLAPNLVVGLLLAFIFTRQIDSPKEKILQAELDRYEKEMVRLNKDMELINEVLDAVEGRDEELYRQAATC